MCICVCECLCAALVLEIRMIRANSPHSCPAALPLLSLVCCLLLLLLLFYSHSHIVYVSMCVCMCASCIVSVFCHGHGLSRRVCVCVCMYLPVFLPVCVCWCVGVVVVHMFLLVVRSVLIRFWMDDMVWLWIAACLCLPDFSSPPSPINPCFCCCSSFSSIYFALSICPFGSRERRRRPVIYECLSLCVCVFVVALLLPSMNCLCFNFVCCFFFLC